MDSMDVVDLARILVALVKVEAMRGANEAAALGQSAPHAVAEFEQCASEADHTFSHMEWWHNRD